MAILTESKIKRLLRTTKLKETKSLVLESGTIITPSAKEYLKDITIEYVKTPELSKTKDKETSLPIPESKTNGTNNIRSIRDVLIYKNSNGEEIWRGQSNYQFKIKIDLIISRILTLQKKGQYIGNMELIEALDTILMVLKAETIQNKLELVQEIEKLLESKNSYILNSYLENSFIPTYKDEECTIALFELHAYLQELEHFIAKEMNEILTFENYINYISIATALKEYCWLLIVQVKEESLKE